jgi:uncharacterized protein
LSEPQPHHLYSRTLAKWIVSYRWPFIVLALLILAVSYDQSTRFRLDRNLEKMFDPNSREIQDFRRLQETFTYNQAILVVVNRIDPLQLESLSKALQQSDSVATVLDLSRLQAIFGTFLDRSLWDQLDALSDRPPENDTASLASQVLESFEGLTHSRDGRYLGVAVLLKPTADRALTIEELKRACGSIFKQDQEYHLVGETVLVDEGFEMIQRDGLRLGWFSSVILCLFMTLVMRTILWAIATLAVVQWSIVVTQGICVIMRWELTMVSSMLIAMITVMGIATSLHWLVSFERYRENGSTSSSSLASSLSDRLWPIVGSCLTTCAAFLALLSARLEPVRDYGAMMALGSLVVLAGIVLIIPAIVLLSITDQNKQRVAPKNKLIDRYLLASFELVLAHRQWVLGSLVIWLAICCVGGLMAEVETDFIRNFNPKSRLVQGYQVVEESFGGAGVWDIVLPVPGPKVSKEYLSALDELSKELLDVSLSSGSSDSDALRPIAKITSISTAERISRSMPFAGSLPLQARLLSMRSVMPEFYDSLLVTVNDRTWCRLMLRSSEGMTARAKMQLHEAARSRLAEFTSRERWQKLFSFKGHDQRINATDAYVAGYSILLAVFVESVVRDQWLSLALAAVLILAISAVFLRSLRLAAIAVVLNVLPSLGIIALMSITGMKLNLGAAMIAAVSLGMSIDASIHYLMEFQRYQEQGASVEESLRRTQTTIGTSLFFATLALVLGFVSLASSDFRPTVVFGSCAAASMAFGLIANLTWLPALVSFSKRGT